MTLTVKEVDAAKPREKAFKLADSAGLYLYVSAAGSKSWRANFVRDGKQVTATFGRYPDMSLAQARRANAMRGESSISTSSAIPVKLAPTFAEAAADWLKLKLPELSNGKHQIQVENTLEKFVFPVIGHRRIDAIPRADLVAMVKAVQERGTVETAHRVAGRVTAVFNLAQDSGLVEHHGAAGLTRVLTSRKVKRPMASIDPSETGALLTAIDGYNEPLTRLGLGLAAHTFVRVGELRGMRWDELREDGAIWVVPEERMKLRIPHVVPLSVQAQALLAKLRLLTGHSELVFESPLRPRHSLSENTFLFALYRLGYRGKMTVHGFRSLASSGLNEHSGFDRDVIERQLAHKETDAVRAAYNRAQYLPKRRELMQWWSDWLESRRTVSAQKPATGYSRRTSQAAAVAHS